MKKRIKRRQSHLSPSLNRSALHPVLKQIYANREITDESQLQLGLANLEPFHLLKDIEKTVALIYKYLVNQQTITIVGDFDADGATSTAVAIKSLKALGATNINFLVPDRFKFGYGLTPELVPELSKLGSKLVITVDNGINSVAGVNLANAEGMEVIITDHHLASDQLPQAQAIVNPNQPEDKFPSKALSGVGVIFYVMIALRSFLREKLWFKEKNIVQPNLAEVLDLVALGTVADMVPLDYNNRILVDQGLKRIRANLACPGIQSLIKIAGRDPLKLVANDLGFSVGPRLNAAGRIDDMSIGIRCLLADNQNLANSFAKKLDNLNQTRRQLERSMLQEALDVLQDLRILDSNELHPSLCLYQANWHQGIVGLIASRLKERYHCPVICFAKTDDGSEFVKGSGRSIESIHIRDLLADIDAQYPSLIHRFGGHAQAAGLTMKLENLDQFQQVFQQAMLSKQTKQNSLSVLSDGELGQQDFNLQFAQAIRFSGPWGQAFPEPVF
ncbi:MAG: single-stranded-DNA-specific exonuclease RecJ, partial [Gammaproteobacteria bacterium]|nr:single-stranded-DNA-specific exonuclease RecJ [Gammaproteobacteria bacterium]